LPTISHSLIALQGAVKVVVVVVLVDVVVVLVLVLVTCGQTSKINCQGVTSMAFK